MKTLYKFVGSRAAVGAIASGSLKFAKVNELNDPAELVPAMNREAVSSSLASIRRDGYSPEQFQWLKRQEAILSLLAPRAMVIRAPATIEQANLVVRQRIFDDMEYMESQLLEAIQLIRGGVGILSLTERFDSLPMWAHYGAQARGFVIRFESLASTFPGDDTGSLNAVMPVHYVDDLTGVTHDPSTQNNLFFCKFRDWGYEREWRVVSPLSSCQRSADGTMYLRPTKPEVVTGVICGWNIPADQIRSLRNELREINPGVEVLTASLKRGCVALPR